MIPLIPTLALALFSFISSAFVILRIVIPILPPHPLSRRVAPKEFGLPNFRPLSPADKSHVWLASCDLFALAFFVWQAVVESMDGPKDFTDAKDSGSAVRLWLAMTVRQTCLLVVAGITLLHVRMGRPVSFGSKHWVLWVPTILIASTSTAIAAIMPQAGVTSLFLGIMAYSTTIAVLSTAAFGCLIGTLVVIRRNLAAINEPHDSWPAGVAEKPPRPSFATEDIDALKDGSSWITSTASSHSRHNSISQFSFSTAHSALTHGSMRAPNPATGSYPSIPAKSSFWFNPGTPYGGRTSPIPPVPPLPSPYRSTSPTSASVANDPDPFRRSVPAMPRMGSQSSWLTETSGTQTTLSAWSFPATRPSSPMPSADVHTDLLPSTAVSRPNTPALSSANVLGGYGYSPNPATLSGAEKGLAALSAPPAKDIDVSVYRIVGWLITIWVPLALSLPCLITVSPDTPLSMVSSIFFVLSVTISSPLLACNIIFRSPLPIPSGLFDMHSEPPSVVMRAPSPATTLGGYEGRYKRSGSVTVIEGRRSGDVWITNGDAVDGKSKVSRAFSLLSPVPKLSVLPPPSGLKDEDQLTPPLPMQTESPNMTAMSTPQSENSVELGRRRLDSKASSHWSGADDSMAFTTRIMIAQRHYSAVAKTMVLPPSPEKRASTGGFSTSTPARENVHLRSRSASSINKSSVSGPRSPISPPPSSPLPPTPPRQTKHQRSNSSGFSFGAVDDVNAIDQLSAGLLPLLVPGLKVGSNMKVTGTPIAKKEDAFNSVSSFESPELHSTPARPRGKTSSIHKRHHFSLPSLGLGRDGIHSLKDEITRALAGKSSVEITEDGRRKMTHGAESMPSTLSHLRPVFEEDELMRPRSPDAQLRPAPPSGTFGALSPPLTHADVPSGFDTARSSMATLIAALEQPPHSAGSGQTMFTISDGPDAESTPHHAQAPPRAVTHDEPAPYTRRSSIVYIKSDENVPRATRHDSGRAPVVRPLAPRPKTLQAGGPGAGKASCNPTDNDTKKQNSTGIRPLSLLRDRDLNRAEPRTGGIRPLALAKKSKQNENAGASAPSPWKLARSATSKARGILRKEEVLPDVVVRPPSTSEHTGFAYTFRS